MPGAKSLLAHLPTEVAMQSIFRVAVTEKPCENSAAMKQVFVSQHLVEAEMRKEQLEQAGIRCMIKNQRASGLAGEIPFVEVFPEVWVLDDRDYERARQVIEDATASLQSNHGHWTCPQCSERHENQFGACWKCGGNKPST